MTISAGTIWYSGAGASTISVSPVAVGDILVVVSSIHQAGSLSGASVSGGGVTTWNFSVTAGWRFDNTSSNYVGLFWGVVTSTGASAITLYGGSGATYLEACAQEFSSSLTGGGTWAQTVGGYGQSATVFDAAVSVPSGDALWAGAALAYGNTVGGSYTGVTYEVFGFESLLAYSTPGANASYQPTYTSTGTHHVTEDTVLTYTPPASTANPIVMIV